MDGISSIPATGQYQYWYNAVKASGQSEPQPTSKSPPLVQSKNAADLSITPDNYQSIENRRAQYVYHKGLDQMVVKIIDTKTDKVVMEFPSAELQRVHVALREAIGLLIDKKA